MNDFQIIHFYGWWQFSICSFAFLALMAIWYHLGKKKGDLGQVWLALSVLCWAVSGFFEIVHTDYKNINISGWRSIFSLLNSLFILYSIPWFRYKPGWLEEVLTSRYWNIIVSIPFVFCLLATLSSMLKNDPTRISELDVYYAIFTLVILGAVLWESFTKRGLPLLGYLSLVFVLITLVSQIYKFSDDDAALLLTAAIFKTILIMIFFALALSWVKDLAEQIQINSNLLSLKLTKHKKGNNRFEYVVEFTGIPNLKVRAFSITAATYHLLEKFCQAKMADPQNGWLEIKPKGERRTQKDYPIKEYTEIKRLTQSILDGLYGKNNWTKDRHEVPFREGLWELDRQKSRNIRIKINAENIAMNNN